MNGRMHEATVSVLLPTFNRARFIGAAIDSVLAQTHAPYEIIVLDDGSTDGTAAICAAYGSAVTYIRSPENKGKSAAINRGLEHAVGDFVWVMDDDDIALPDALESLLRPMLANPRVGFAYGGLMKFTENAKGVRTFEPPAPEAPFDSRRLFVRLMEDCFITGQPCALLRRSCFDAIGRIDETVLASVDYNILLQVARRFEGVDVGKTVLWQRQHSGLRGPIRLRYCAQQRVERWKAFDARLLGDLLPQLDLEEFLRARPLDRTMSATERRQALFQKAAIAARKELWPIAIQSLARARAEAGETPLNDRDRLILSKMLGCRYGIDQFIGDRQLQIRLSAAAGGGPTGLAIREAIASHLPYWIGQGLRRSDLVRTARTIAALHRLEGARLAVRSAMKAMERKIGAGLPDMGDTAKAPARPI